MARHFNYYENGGPAPSSCLSCGRNNTLFDLGREIPIVGGMAQLCLTCAKELAVFVGYAEKAPLDAEIENLKAQLVSRETEIATIPNHVEDLINGIRSNVTDFIFAVSYSPSIPSDSPVQDDSGNDDAANGSGKAKKRSDSASVKPAVD